MTEKELQEVAEMLEAQQAKHVAERTEAIEKRDACIGLLLALSNEAVGEGFKAYAANMRDKALPEVSADDAQAAHDLIADIINLDMWWG